MNRTLSLLAAAALPIFAAQPPAATVPATPAAAPAAEIPIATFFRAATIDKLTFSPNGKYVACLVPFEHRMNLAIIDLEKGTKNLITNFKDRDVIAPYWANDERIVGFHRLISSKPFAS